MISFSVIIPVRNGARTLGRCLDSVFASVPRPEEVIVVNDGSKDETSAVASRYPCRILAVSIGLGPMQPRFAGAAAARGDVLVFVDADVEIPSGVLARLLSHFRDPGVDAVTGLLAGDSPVKKFSSHFKNEYMNYIFSSKPRESSFLYGSLFAVRAGAMIEFEPVNEPFGCLVSDSELGFRLKNAGCRILFDRECAVRHLKEYSLAGLIRNDFVIPFMFARIFSTYASRTPWIERRGFSHASAAQTLAAASAAFMFAASFLARATEFSAWRGLAWIAAGYFTLYWAPFLKRLWKKRGFFFALRAGLLLPLDASVMFYGMVSGFAWTLFRAVTVAARAGRKEILCPKS